MTLSILNPATTAAVRLKYSGLPPDKNRFNPRKVRGRAGDYTPAEEDFLREHGPHHSTAWLAEKLGRSRNSVRIRLSKMRITRMASVRRNSIIEALARKKAKQGAVRRESK